MLAGIHGGGVVGSKVSGGGAEVEVKAEYVKYVGKDRGEIKFERVSELGNGEQVQEAQAKRLEEFSAAEQELMKAVEESKKKKRVEESLGRIVCAFLASQWPGNKCPQGGRSSIVPGASKRQAS
jgi:hypothetical protein